MAEKILDSYELVQLRCYHRNCNRTFARPFECHTDSLNSRLIISLTLCVLPVAITKS